MVRFPFGRKNKESRWELEPGDLPPEKLMAREPALRGIEHNAAFRAMAFTEHGDKKEPTLKEAFKQAQSTLLTMTELEPRFLKDLLMARCTGEDLANARLGHLAARRKVTMQRGVALFMIIAVSPALYYLEGGPFALAFLVPLCWSVGVGNLIASYFSPWLRLAFDEKFSGIFMPVGGAWKWLSNASQLAGFILINALFWFGLFVLSLNNGAFPARGPVLHIPPVLITPLAVAFTAVTMGGAGWIALREAKTNYQALRHRLDVAIRMERDTILEGEAKPDERPG